MLNVTSGSAGFDGVSGVVQGMVSLSGASAIEFASGGLTRVAAGSSLRLVGAKAFVETSTALGSNSALTGLSTDLGALSLENGAIVSTSALLTDAGTLTVDTLPNEGGSRLTAGGLKVTGALGVGNANLSAATTVKAGSLNSTGSITLTGSASFQALLNITAVAGFGTAGVLTGVVDLSGKSAVEFANNSILSIAAGSSLRLAGGAAFVEDASALGSNSALTGLQSVAGALTLDANQTVSVTAAFANAGVFNIDAVTGEGGSTFTTPAAFTNSGF